MRYENIIEDCRMQEEEACQEEEISHEQEEEEVTDAEMVDEEERGDAEASDPQGAADTEGIPPLDPAGDAVSPEEDAFLTQPASQAEDPTAGSQPQERDWYGLGRDGRSEPDLAEPTWAWGR